MIKQNARLILKSLRFEASVMVAVSFLLGVLLLGEGWRLLSLNVSACADAAPPTDCAVRQAEFDGQFMTVVGLQLAAALATVFGGLALGAAIVGREIERGTTSLAWSLARSRIRWLLARWLVVGLVILALSYVVGLATEPMAVAMRATGRVGAFDGIEVRAPILALRAAVAFTLAVLTGALLGRALPGLLVAALLIPLLVLAVDQGMGMWLRSEARAIDINAVNTARITDTEWRDLGTGRVLSRLEYLTMTPPPGAPPDWDTTTFEPIPLGVPDSEAGAYVAVESLLLGGVAAVLLSVACVAVERRRPY